MKNFAFQNRVLQNDRVLERRVLEREYCIAKFSQRLDGSERSDVGPKLQQNRNSKF
jgi:hypothetical protein